MLALIQLFGRILWIQDIKFEYMQQASVLLSPSQNIKMGASLKIGLHFSFHHDQENIFPACLPFHRVLFATVFDNKSCIFYFHFSNENNPVIKHYHIKETSDSPKKYYLAEKHVFDSVWELINYHQHNAAGLVTRLRYAVSSRREKAPVTAGLSYGKWQINPQELTFEQEIGVGQFGVVHLGYWLNQMKVAIKTIRPGAMSEEDFIEEAQVMMKLSHPKLVQLHGICMQHTPMCLVFEFMEYGCLSDYLRRQRGSFSKEDLLGMCQDVCEGMTYLEQASVIHRDLAARNCLVGEFHVVKVSDFGMSRYVLDDQYTSSMGTKFPVRWSAPEVFSYNRYSTKSDVWSFGVLMWETFSEGRLPYENKTNAEVVEEISAGARLYKPRLASNTIYKLMQCCWSEVSDVIGALLSTTCSSPAAR
uniref:non-specific protein-tyrosine kinase n=1 Tax=Varanus komodoensis TaxID=61221 RepID=A0A8D2LAB5_VARKO